MAPADQLAPAGSSSYTSDTMNVGDGTWDFTKNDFLLPNLVGFNFETMRYNGMGNRFSSVSQYHSLIKGHGAVAVITFLFIIPLSAMIARFYDRRSGYAMRYHTYLNIVAGLLSTVVLITGWFAVGPNRSLTNPHHGIGIAIYTLVLVQIIGGRLVRHLAGRHSLRLTIHKWSGRTIALLGIVQVPLGLTLYGSPKVLFILFSLWMAFVFFVYFVLSYRHEGRRDHDVFVEGHSEAPPKSSSGGMLRWLGPLAAGAGAWALLRGRNKDKERSPSRSRRDSRSRATSRSRSRSRSYYSRADMQSSRRESDSFVDDEKLPPNRKRAGGGFMDKLFAAGAAAGAGALLTSFMSNRKKKNRDEEYSAVATDTPSRPPPGRYSRPPPRRNTAPLSEVSYFTEDTRTDLPGSPTPGGRRHYGPSGAAAAGAAAGAAAAASIGTSYRDDSYRGDRPITPRPSHQRTHSIQDQTVDGSDYSSYQSPSRRTPPASGRAATAGKGFLGGMGLGWLANRFSRRPEPESDEHRRREEDDRRAGDHGPRYTGDGYGSPVRRDRRQRPPPSVPSEITQTNSYMSDSIVESHPARDPPAVMPPSAGGSRQSYPVTPGANTRQSRSSILRSRQDIEPIKMPDMPPSSDSDSLLTAQRRRRSTSRRRAEAESLAAGSAATGAMGRSSSQRPSEDGRSSMYPPPSNHPSATVKLKVHDDRGGNITLRRFTEAEAAAERDRTGRGSSQQRRPNDSVSSLSGTESPSNRRYRRDSSVRPSEPGEQKSGSIQQQAPYQSAAPSSTGVLDPPNPPFAGGRRPKDSAYYSGGQGAAGPSGTNPAAGRTMTSIESRETHGTWSAMSPSTAAGPAGSRAPDVASNAAAERRRRRRLERSDTGRQSKVDYQ